MRDGRSDTGLLEFFAHTAREEWTLFFVGSALVLLVGLAVRFGAPKKKRPVPMISAVVFFVLYVVIFLARSPIEAPAARSILGSVSVLFLALSAGRLLFLLVFDVMIGRQREEPVPRIVRDIVQGLVFFFLALWSLRSVGVEPSSLLTTSALLTVVAGLALQETLGNLVAGLATQLDKPFEVGDWIEVHDSKLPMSRVVEVSWRATRVRTLDNVTVAIPNGMIAKAAVTNFSRRREPARRSVRFHGPYHVSPLSVHRVAMEAIREVSGVLGDPAPSIVTSDYHESGIEYWLRYFISDMSRRDAIDGAVRDRIWGAFARAGVSFPFPTRTIYSHQVNAEVLAAEQRSTADRHRTALARTEIFSTLSPGDLAWLAERVRRAPYAPGEAVVRQGDAGDTMFVVDSGELAVQVGGPDGPREISRLGAGSYFGEMSLLTGAPRTATVVAMGACDLLVIEHRAFRELLDTHPEVAQKISQKVAEHQQRLDTTGTMPAIPISPAAIEAHSSVLLEKIRRFFGGAPR